MLEAQGVSVAGRLADVHCTLRPGEVTAICGPNGAGKSSLLETMAGLLPADRGEVLLDRQPLARFKPQERARLIGYLAQEHMVAWDVPVRRLVELGRMPHGDRRAEPVEAALQALDLCHLEDRRAQTLSGGEIARVLLARVLAGEPQWIMADEPLSALDLGHQLSLLAHLRSAAMRGIGTVLVLHDLAYAMNHADRVLVLDRGHLVADGPPQDALSVERIEQVWNVKASWIGTEGRRALTTG